MADKFEQTFKDNSDKAVLVVVVGKSPLPIFVTVEYFLRFFPQQKNFQVVYFVVTLDSEKESDRLIAVFQKKYTHVNFGKVLLSSSSNQKAIADDIDEKLLKSLREEGIRSFHLDYTGGTKAMAVTVYRKLLDFSQEINCHFSASYLEPSVHSLFIENQPESIDLREAVSAEISEIAELHGFVESKLGGFNLAFNDDKARSELHSLIELIRSDFRRGSVGNVFAAFEKLMSRTIDKEQLVLNIDNKQKLSVVRKQWQKWVSKLEKTQLDMKKISPYLEALPVNLCPFDTFGRLLVAPESDELFRSWINTMRFFYGFWLEVLMADILRDYFSKSKKNVEVATNQSFSPISTQNVENPFELDILLKYGYVITAVSCTVESKKSIVKQKVFEVMQRVEQITGYEAPAALICGCNIDQRDSLRNDCKKDRGRGQKFLTLTKDDLREDILQEKFSDLIFKGKVS